LYGWIVIGFEELPRPTTESSPPYVPPRTLMMLPEDGAELTAFWIVRHGEAKVPAPESLPFWPST
jgi:hypothetical protein